MNRSVLIPKKSPTQQAKNRNPSIAVRDDDANLSKIATNIDLSKFMTSNQPPKNKWLTHLHEKPLLQLMADSIQQKHAIPVNSSELNCYERLKKLLCTQTGKNYDERQSAKHENMFEGVAIMEDKLNQMEAKYQSTHTEKKKESKFARPYLHSNSTSFYDKKGANNSLNTTQKSMNSNNHSVHNLKKMPLRPHERKSHGITSVQTKQHIREFKSKCCEKFIDHKREVTAKVYEEIEGFIETKIERKMSELISCKFSQMEATKEENQRFKMILLEKDLEIQALKKQLKIKEQKIRQKESTVEAPCGPLAHHKAQVFLEEYRNVFGDYPLGDLKRKIDQLENLYFNKYAFEETKYLQKYGCLTRQKEEVEKLMKSQQLMFEQREKALQQLVYQIRKNQLLDNSSETHEVYKKIPQYKMRCAELQNLQKFIFNQYIKWRAAKSEGESKINLLLNPKQVEDYQQMIENMLEFNENFANSSKNIEYLTKLLGAVQKLKKVIAPSKCFEKLEPLKVLEQVELILKNPKRRRERKLKTLYRQNVDNSQQYLIDN